MRYFTCEQCGGKCCKFLTITMDNNPDWDAYYKLRGKIMYSKRFGKMVVIATPCSMLDENGKCKDYENRPDFCKNMNEKTLENYCVPIGCKYDVTGEFGEDYGV